SKRLELLKEVIPMLARVAYLAHMGNPTIVRSRREVESAAWSLGVAHFSMLGSLKISGLPSMPRATSEWTRSSWELILLRKQIANSLLWLRRGIGCPRFTLRENLSRLAG